MQVFVKRRALQGGGTGHIDVIAHYADEPVVPSNAHGPDAAKLTLPPSAIRMDPQTGMATLQSSWQSSGVDIVKGEAARRISEVFPDYMQRNAVQETQSMLTQFGPDQNAWPSDAKRRKATYDAAWNYVNAVRQTSNAMENSLPQDPTNDSHWPRVIPRVKTQ